MRSQTPMRGDPWPPDMVIAVNDGGALLLPLLFLHEAWDLRTMPLPPLDPAPDVGRSYRPATATADEWRARWRDAWSEAVDAAGSEHAPPSGKEALQDWTRAWMQLLPKPFTEVWGADGFDDTAYRAWVTALRPPERHHRPLDEHPERRALPALIGAWERGLRIVVTLPFALDWSAQGGPHHLLIAARTREDTAAYSGRLELFGAQ